MDQRRKSSFARHRRDRICSKVVSLPLALPAQLPGDLGFDPLGINPEDPAEFRLMQEKELSHCRLAMIAAAGFLAQEAVTGETWGSVWGDASF